MPVYKLIEQFRLKRGKTVTPMPGIVQSGVTRDASIPECHVCAIKVPRPSTVVFGVGSVNKRCEAGGSR